jgi:uncharacterized protein (TIGR02117 family)
MTGAAAALLFAALAGCALPRADRLAVSTSPPDARTVYVIAHGWHTGIAVRAADVPEGAWPARGDFPDAEFLEVGWGDRAYYQAPDPGAWLAVRALFWSTPGALHFVAFNGPVERYFPASEIVPLATSREGFARLVAYVRASHALDADGGAIRLGPGQYGASRFYASREQFHLFRTCNVWTADVLRAAGVPVEPAVTAEGLLWQLRRIATPTGATR